MLEPRERAAEFGLGSGSSGRKTAIENVAVNAKS
jgi:hypothetical protein